MSELSPVDIAAIAELKPEEVSNSLKSARVLVVDGSRMMRAALTRSLNELGFTHISEAGDGKAAMTMLLEQDFDLMLMSMELPILNGIEVLTAMRLSPKTSQVPVIVISGADQIEKVVQCIEAGAEDYLPKPPNPTLLRARVTTSLEKKRFRDLDRIRFAQLKAEKELVELEKEKSERLPT
jgi:PleD family two-component response regulator